MKGCFLNTFSQINKTVTNMNFWKKKTNSVGTNGITLFSMYVKSSFTRIDYLLSIILLHSAFFFHQTKFLQLQFCAWDFHTIKLCRIFDPYQENTAIRDFSEEILLLSNNNFQCIYCLWARSTCVTYLTLFSLGC